MAETSTSGAARPSTSSDTQTYPVDIFYCGEYCEFGSHLTRCKAWLQQERPDLFDRYYSDDALSKKVGTLSLEAQAKLEEEAAKKERKAEAKADAEAKKLAASKVTIKRIERNKKKHVTAVQGLETFGIDLKKAAKQFATKFATGASVSKNAQGVDEIVVQGDVTHEIVELIEGNVGVLKGVPADTILCVEDKKKKGGTSSEQ